LYSPFLSFLHFSACFHKPENMLLICLSRQFCTDHKAASRNELQEGICENLFFVFHDLKVIIKERPQTYEIHSFSYIFRRGFKVFATPSKDRAFEKTANMAPPDLRDRISVLIRPAERIL